jgi:AcrR family transcriptional regulator
MSDRSHFATRISRMPIPAAPGPRKRPVQSRSQATVDAIIDAAARILVRDGYGAFTTNRVAATAGVSVGSLYQYFPTKEAIVAALIERRAEADVERVSKLLDELRGQPLSEVIARTVDDMIELHRSGGPLYRVMLPLVVRVRRHRYVRELIAKARERVRDELEARRDEVRKEDLELAVFVSGHALEACIHAALDERPELLSDPAFARELTDLAVRYLTKDPS